jgi:hypothetical protein
VEPKPSPLEQCWDPGPVAGSRFTDAEMKRITISTTDKAVQKAVERVAPGWKISKCGPDMDPGLRKDFRGKKNVLVTHPLRQGIGCVLSRTVDVPSGKKTWLQLVVTHDPRGDWTLIVKANSKRLAEVPINADAVSASGWAALDVELSQFAGRSVKLELINHPDDWKFEAAYSAEITVQSR